MATTETSAGNSPAAKPPGATAMVGDPRRWQVLVVLCLALLVVGIDGTIVNVALPTLVRDIHASSSELQVGRRRLHHPLCQLPADRRQHRGPPWAGNDVL